MKKIGIFFSHNTKNSAAAAQKIIEAIGKTNVEEVNVETLEEEQFLSFENMILSVPTWFDGELPNYWDEFVPALEDLDLKGKVVAIYGMADQKGYPQNFADAVGIMAGLIEQQGGTVIGEWPIEGYVYERSRAVKDGKFAGLVLDNESQADLTEERIAKWVKIIKPKFKK